MAVESIDPVLIKGSDMARALNVSICLSAPLRDSVVADPSQPLPPLPRPLAPPPGPPPPDFQELQHRAFQNVIASLQEAAARCELQYDAMLREIRQSAIELGIAVAGRLVLDKAEAGDFPIEAIVRNVVSRLTRRPTVDVHLHPQDLATLHERLREGVADRGGPTIRFHTDPTVSRGGCRTVAGGVTILSDITLQLADLRQHLLESIL